MTTVRIPIDGVRRVVTDQQVGVLVTRCTKRAAQREADDANAAPPPRPIEYVARRRGLLRWDVVALQARLEPVRRRP